jgi:NTP pyrophosphatase (non-canonical NTP hydrolase)
MNLTNDEFYEPIHQSLAAVQALFDGYQREKFTERPPEFFSLELCGEAGELANLEKKRWKGKAIPIEALQDEAADVLIALMNYANARGIHLGRAVHDKLLRIEEKRAALEAQGEAY